MKIRIIRNCGIKGTFEVKRLQEGCYVIEHNGIDCLINVGWCEVIEENKTELKTIRILKDLKIGLKEGDILTEELEEGERYTLFKSGTYKGLTINKNCFEYVEDKSCNNCDKYKDCYDNGMQCPNLEKWKPVEKDIELPDEFYFKSENDTTIFKAIKSKNNNYEMFINKESVSYCSVNLAKINIKKGNWIIIDKPVDNIEKCREQQKEINELSKNVYNTITTVFNNIIDSKKKVRKFIKLTTQEGFATYIAKDKIISLVQYENITFISTVDIDGNCTVIEKVDDIIKMLEE